MKLSLPHGINDFINMVDFIRYEEFVNDLNRHEK